MADDNVLAGLGGFFEGFQNVLVPFVQMKYKNDMERQAAKERIDYETKAQKDLYSYKVPFEKDMTQYKAEVEAANRPLNPIYDSDSNFVGNTQGSVQQLKGSKSKSYIQKSVLLDKLSKGENVSPEDYQVVDDSQAQKLGTEDELASLLDSLDSLRTARKQMRGVSRAAASVPYVSGVAKLKSSGVSQWDAEYKLFTQRLAKLIEKNRLSDKDREFYLGLISKPMASDDAFNKGMAAVERNIRGKIKESKQTTVASPIDNSNTTTKSRPPMSSYWSQR